MWEYEKKLQYPVRIKNTNPALAQFVASQYGGPDGELGASLRYLSQRFSAPYPEVKAILNDIGISEVILHPPEMGFFELDKGFAVLLTNRTTMRYSKYNKYGQAGATAKHKAGRAYRKIILTLCAKEFYE